MKTTAIPKNVLVALNKREALLAKKDKVRVSDEQEYEDKAERTLDLIWIIFCKLEKERFFERSKLTCVHLSNGLYLDKAGYLGYEYIEPEHSNRFERICYSNFDRAGDGGASLPDFISASMDKTSLVGCGGFSIDQLYKLLSTKSGQRKVWDEIEKSVEGKYLICSR